MFPVLYTTNDTTFFFSQDNAELKIDWTDDRTWKFFNFAKVSNKNTWYMLIMLVVQLSLKKSAKIVMLVFSQLSKKYAGLVERASIISFLLNSYWVCRSTRDCIEKTTSFNVTSVIERTCWCSGWKRYWPNSVQSNWNQSRSCKVLGNSSDSVRDAHNTLAHFSDFYTFFFLEVNHFYMKQNNLKLLVLKPHWTAFILVTSVLTFFLPRFL